MATTLPNLGLTKWDLTSDPYSHSQLAANFQAIDDHDHTGSPYGKKLGTNSLNDGSITSAKLADGAVITAKIADGAVTLAKLDNGARIPLGVVVPWWRPSPLITPPTGWVVPTGQSLTDNLSSIREHDFYPATGGTIILPDLRNRFILGATLTSPGLDPASAPDLGATGGSQTISLAHTHSVLNHTHGVPAHVHTIDGHSHTVSDHSHTISGDGAHSHTFASGRTLYTRQTATISVYGATNGAVPFTGYDDYLQTTYIDGYNSGFGAAPAFMDQVANHTHGGATGTATGLYTGSTALSTNPGTGAITTDPAGASTDSQLSASADNRPAFVGLLFLIKVKY